MGQSHLEKREIQSVSRTSLYFCRQDLHIFSFNCRQKLKGGVDMRHWHLVLVVIIAAMIIISEIGIIMPHINYTTCYIESSLHQSPPSFLYTRRLFSSQTRASTPIHNP